MSINNLIEQDRNVQLVVNAADLKELFLEWSKEKDSQIQATEYQSLLCGDGRNKAFLYLSKLVARNTIESQTWTRF